MRDLRPAVLAAGLEQRDLDVGILAEARRKHASRRSRADDHVVVHREPPSLSGSQILRPLMVRSDITLHRPHGRDDLVRARQIGVLERRAERDRRKRRADALDRRVEVVERRSPAPAPRSRRRSRRARPPRARRRAGPCARPTRRSPSRSSGTSVRGSITSASIPSSARALGGRERIVDEARERDDRDVAALRGA